MSLLLYSEPARAVITSLDINGQGPEARLDPGTPLTIKGQLKVQNPNTDPTDTVQLILFREDEFLKCVFNDVPALAPNFSTESFTFRCTAPDEPGKYRIRVGWAYNWNWPDQAYNYLLANPENIVDIGVLYVGKYVEVGVSLLPIVLVAIPVGTVIGMIAASKK